MIYLDNHATTKCAPEVIAAMMPFFAEDYANPSGISHAFGRQVQERVENARETIASLIGCSPDELVFTSGATESNNLAINGLLGRRTDGHVITTQIEHPSVLAPIQQAERRGVRVTRLRVDRDGKIDLIELAKAIEPDTLLVSIMAANNEIGTLQDFSEISKIVRQSSSLLHVDATQAVGKIPCPPSRLDADLMSFSGHKIHGPKGIGALFVRQKGRRVRLYPQLFGGGQEKGLRSGTVNVPGVIGLEAALKLASSDCEATSVRVGKLRNDLFQRLKKEIPDIVLNGPDLEGTSRLANNLNCQFPGVEGQTLAMTCSKVAMSSGSACSAVQTEPSHVLTAIGLDIDQVRSSLRFGLSRYTTQSEISQAAELIVAAYRKLRAESVKV